YPLTAVAKDAGGSKWDKGAEYLWNLLSPYVLLVPLAAVLVAGMVALWARLAPRSDNPLLPLRIRYPDSASGSRGTVADPRGGGVGDGGGDGGGADDHDDDEGGRLPRLRRRARST